MLILEGFQAGLSWECVLNKREAFREAFDNFDVQKVANYDADKLSSLADNPKIIRNKLKINASARNANVFIKYRMSSIHLTTTSGALPNEKSSMSHATFAQHHHCQTLSPKT